MKPHSTGQKIVKGPLRTVEILRDQQRNRILEGCTSKEGEDCMWEAILILKSAIIGLAVDVEQIKESKP